MNRSLRFLICLMPLVTFGAAAADAAESALPFKTASLESASICARTPTAETQQKAGASMKMRLAACRCCGWETTADGHKMCVHQCCD
jgi:predicted Zn-ribbon and HTH transcriptional regulator